MMGSIQSRTMQIVLSLLLAMGASSALQAQTAIEDIQFVSMPGDRFQIQLSFNEAPPEPETFVIENPARISMDFSDVVNRLDQNRYPLDFGNAESVVVLEAQGRTRMVVNLVASAGYTTSTQDNSLFITVGSDAAAGAQTAVAAQAAAQQGQAGQAPGSASQGDIRNVDFRRDTSGAGEIIIEMARRDLVGNVSRAGNRLELEFLDADLAEALEMRLDVTDFATPVEFVDVYSENDNVMVSAEVGGEFDYIAYQSGTEYILSISPVMGAQAAAQAQEFPFTGEPISLNFQDIDVRSVLQILADFNDFNLVVSDNVSGNITLRLEEVPWDQALDMVLRARGLDQRREGDVMYVAPAAEIADAELQALENEQQQEALAPLQTEYLEINYAVASNLAQLLRTAGAADGGEGVPAGSGRGILSPRGSVSVDERTNTLIITDVADKVDEARAMVERLDVPVRQVLIEARIVNASTNFSDALGVRWGGVHQVSGTGDQFTLGSNFNTIETENTNTANYNVSLNEAVAGGQTPAQARATTIRERVSVLNDALAVDLGVGNATSTFALGYLGNSGLLELELSALENSGDGEVIAQPKVATQDKQLARIESGVQVPYQAQAGGTAGGSTTEFIPAVLSLEVTPQITPDNRIIMLLDIHQDSVTPGPAGSIPAISTNAVNTRVLVDNGETVVLGGVFREETTTTVSKTPVLGDLPYVGNIFKRTENNESKTELLIFITPSILNDL